MEEGVEAWMGVGVEDWTGAVEAVGLKVEAAAAEALQG
jgi:hypothetical protein